MNRCLDWVSSELLVPFLSMFTTLGIAKNNMRHHTPWAKRRNVINCQSSLWYDIFLYLRVNERWELSDFFNFLGPQGALKACHQFPQLVEGNLIYLLLDCPSLIGSKTRILDLSPGLSSPSKKPNYESSLGSTTILSSRTVMAGRRFIFRYIGHLE